jgi:hypothetical protein
MQLHKEDMTSDQDWTDHPQNVVWKLDVTSSNTQFRATHISKRHISRSDTYLERHNAAFHVTSFFLLECFHLILQKSTPCLNHLYNEQKNFTAKKSKCMLLVSVPFNANIIKPVRSNRHSVV